MEAPKREREETLTDIVLLRFSNPIIGTGFRVDQVVLGNRETQQTRQNGLCSGYTLGAMSQQIVCFFFSFFLGVFRVMLKGCYFGL